MPRSLLLMRVNPGTADRRQNTYTYTYLVCIYYYMIYIYVCYKRTFRVYNIYLYIMYICKLHIYICVHQVVMLCWHFLFFFFFSVPLYLFLLFLVSHVKTRLTVSNRLNNILKRRRNNTIL